MLLYTLHTDNTGAGVDPLVFLDYYQPGTPHLSLEEELRLVGILVPPQKEFYWHRALLTEPYRTGNGRYFWRIGVLIERSKILCTLVCLFCFLGIYAIGIGLYHNITWTLIAGLVTGTLASFCAYCALNHGAHWSRTTLFNSAFERTIPLNLLKRAQAARDVKGTTVLLEVFNDDPLIVVLRGAEKVYIGAWNTGNQNLDSK